MGSLYGSVVFQNLTLRTCQSCRSSSMLEERVPFLGMSTHTASSSKVFL